MTFANYGLNKFKNIIPPGSYEIGKLKIDDILQIAASLLDKVNEKHFGAVFIDDIDFRYALFQEDKEIDNDPCDQGMLFGSKKNKKYSLTVCDSLGILADDGKAVVSMDDFFAALDANIVFDCYCIIVNGKDGYVFLEE